MREILADAPDPAVVLSLDVDRHRVALLRGLVPHLETGEMAEELARALDADLVFRLDVHGDGVTGEHRHPDRRRRDQEVRCLEDLARLVDELPFLARVAVRFFFQAEDGIRDLYVTGVQTCALPI